jgi:heme exporter protein A
VTIGPALDFETVDVRDVSRQFGRRRALAHVSLTCRAGDIVGLLGPNGAGKSTLLGILSTLVRPTSGEVRYGAHLASDAGDPLRACIGMLGHDLFLYGDLTARENLEFFGRLYGVADRKDRVDEALRHARLEDRAGDRVSAFSRGLRQRLALERALLHRPRLVLLDEPFTGLDDESGAVLAARLRSLRATGAIVLMATHDFESADGLVDRAVCLQAGRVRAVDDSGGTLRERYRRAIAGGTAS